MCDFYNYVSKVYADGSESVRMYSRPVRINYDSISHFGQRGASVNPADSERSSRSRSVQRIYDYARNERDSWRWFVTFTFNPLLVDSFNYCLVSSKLSNWLDVLRRKVPGIKYLIVPELHKSGRYHFHGLFSEFPADWISDSGHVDKSGRIIYNLSGFRWGFTTMSLIEDPDCTISYISKYMTKELENSIPFNKKRFWASRSLNLPDVSKLNREVTPLDMFKEHEGSCTWSKSVETVDDVGNCLAYTVYAEFSAPVVSS